MPTAAQLFSLNGGLLTFAGRFALASYHLGSSEIVREGVNLRNSAADAAFTGFGSTMRWLGAADLPSLAPVASGNSSFPTTGLSGGVFTNANAAAIVGRTSDALFIGFRGTNDTSGAGDVLFGTPDNNQWGTPEHYYAALSGLIAAVDAYVANAANGITKVYVAGHSLGGAAVQEFMRTHSGALYQAFTFGSIGTNLASGANEADPRQTNIWINFDIARVRFAATHEDRGDNNFVSSGLGVLDAAEIHDMRGYAALAAFLETQSIGASILNSTTRDYDNVVLRASTYDTAAGSFTFGRGNDYLNGTSAADIMVGGINSDTLNGGSGNDYLSAGSGQDVLRGGAGVDYLRGGTYRDLFDFNSITETGRSYSTRDQILDFQRGVYVNSGDDIDLSSIDARASSSRNDAFTFIGAQGFHRVQGELHYVDYGAHVIVEGDVNGDGRADFSIVVRNVPALGTYDFIL